MPRNVVRQVHGLGKTVLTLVFIEGKLSVNVQRCKKAGDPVSANYFFYCCAFYFGFVFVLANHFVHFSCFLHGLTCFCAVFSNLVC